LHSDKNVKNLILIFLFSVLFHSGWSQTPDYPVIFGEDWKKAEVFEKENRSWIEPLLIKNHISYPLAMSVVFPEILRYSALRDKMEVSLLKTLYVNLGEEYADFSIGVFQMKPSFAETIREESTAFLGNRAGIKFKTAASYDDIKDFRKSIIKDLEDPESQVIYLVTFIRLCEKKFDLTRFTEVSRIKFISSAYNSGIDKTMPQIMNMADKKFFSTKIIKAETYSYSEISIFWYKQFSQGR
jgi:hypothetical protein